MFNPDAFLTAARAAAGTPDAVPRLQSLLQEAIADPVGVSGSLPQTDEAEVVLHASRELTVYHIQLPPQIHYPPHSHGVTALIGTYRGSELNVLYARATSGITERDRRTCQAGEVIVLDPDTIHSVANGGRDRSGAIHFYLGDLARQPRSLWRADGTEEQGFDEDLYFELAVPLET